MAEPAAGTVTPILTRLRDWLAAERLDRHAQLPPERTLSQALGVSRGELRKALTVLEHRGVLARQVGRGTYLTRPLTDVVMEGYDRTTKSLADRTSPHEAMVARLSLEPELASLAAIHATPHQLNEASDLSDQMRVAKDWANYESLDAKFHDLIAQASGNPLLHELHRILNEVRVFVVWGKLPMPLDRPPKDYHSFAEHDAIIAALRHHDRTGAHEAMHTHLKAILAVMIFDE